MTHATGRVLGGTLAGATLLGYVLSRTVGLRAATDDIGNWSETLGVLSLVAEGVVVALAAVALRRPTQGGAAMARA